MSITNTVLLAIVSKYHSPKEIVRRRDKKSLTRARRAR